MKFHGPPSYALRHQSRSVGSLSPSLLRSTHSSDSPAHTRGRSWNSEVQSPLPRDPPYPPPRPARLWQCFATFAVSLGSLAVGTVIGYASPATYQLRQPDTTDALVTEAPGTDDQDALTLTSAQLSWFSAAFSVGALLGGVLSSPLLGTLGRRGTMMVSVLPSLTGWLVLGFGSNLAMLVSGRVLTGMYSGLACVSVNTYIGEIASSDIRGILGSSFQFMFGWGIVYSYVFGSFTTWYNLAFICCGPPLAFALLLLAITETPAFLVAKGRNEEARQALQVLKGKDYDVSAELLAVKRPHADAACTKAFLADLSKPHILKPLAIVLSIMAFQQLSGINALIFNLATIFKSAGSSLSDYTSSVLCAAVQAGATVLAVLFIETAGRRRLLVVSASVMALSHAVVGTFFLLLERDEAWTRRYLGWLPVVAVMVFMMAFSLGFGPIPWIMMGELFPPSVRESAASLATVTNWTMSFLVIFSFDFLQEHLLSYGFYWLFSGFCVLAAFFSAFAVVETKGLTLEEIADVFGGPASAAAAEVPAEP